MKQKRSVEDYLKTIYIFSQKKKVHGSDIAKELGVFRPTVSVALKERVCFCGQSARGTFNGKRKAYRRGNL